MIATVEEPCAVLSTEVSRNGNKRPRLPRETAWLKWSPIFVAASTAPKAPPAPMMMRIPPAFSAPSDNNLLTVFFFQFGIEANASKMPIDNAITGSPANEKIFNHPEPWLPMTKKDLTAISMMGTMTGKNAFIVDGGWDCAAGNISSSMVIGGVVLPACVAHQNPISMAGIAAMMPYIIN